MNLSTAAPLRTPRRRPTAERGGVVLYQCRGPCRAWLAASAFQPLANPRSACGIASECRACSTLRRAFSRRRRAGDAVAVWLGRDQADLLRRLATGAVLLRRREGRTGEGRQVHSWWVDDRRTGRGLTRANGCAAARMLQRGLLERVADDGGRDREAYTATAACALMWRDGEIDWATFVSNCRKIGILNPSLVAGRPDALR